MAEPTTASRPHFFTHSQNGDWRLPPPQAAPKPPIANYTRPAQHAVDAPQPPAPRTRAMVVTSAIAAWKAVVVLALLFIFIASATAGAFEIAHMAIAVGCMVLAGTSGAVAFLLGWDHEPMRGRVKLLEEVAVHLLDRPARGRS